MKEIIRISGKDLGAVALADFCPRCFWIKLHNKGQIPFQIFPGIFSSIDAYTKRVVHAWFDESGSPPPWLKELDGVTGYKEPPTFHKFNTIVDEFDINLTGSPDGVFVRNDGSLMIVDYKTAKFTGNQDNLHPMYEAQLNAYALAFDSSDPNTIYTVTFKKGPPSNPGLIGLARARSLGPGGPSPMANSFRRWASSLPLSRPHGLCRWQILFAISQMAQIPSGSSP